MIFLRRHLVWLVSGWLAIQAAGVVGAPVALWHLLQTHADQECDCPIEAGAACPMHHQSRPQQDGTCKLRNAFGPSDQAYLQLAGGSGVLPSTTGSVITFGPGAPIRSRSAVAISRTSTPDAPPPRT